jgi:hypothetical protein
MRVSISFASQEDIAKALATMHQEMVEGRSPTLTVELEDADGLPFEEGEAMTVEFVNEGGEEPNEEFATPVAALHRDG